MSEAAVDDAQALRLKLKLPRSMSTSSEAEKKLLIGARGGAAVKELLSTAPNIEVAIREFQAAHGVAEAHAQLVVRKKESECKETEAATTLTPAMQLLDLLQVPRTSLYHSLLDQMKKEMLLRIADLPQSDLPRVLEQTFPYIEFRELRAIPIAVLARQEETPALYLRELTENRRILAELPVHVRRKILQVDKRELQLLVEECTREYVTEQSKWYLDHPMSDAVSAQCSPTWRTSADNVRHGVPNRKRSAESSPGGSLWNVSSHVPPSADTGSSSSSAASGFGGKRCPLYSPEERRRNHPALMKLVDMFGDSEALYLSTIEIWRGYLVAATIPGGAVMNHPKEYVDYVSLLGAMRNDLANLHRDRTTTLLRTDPLHKFIWFLDRALKNCTLEIAQLHELLGFIGRLRTSDLPTDKKFRKKSGAEEEQESFEVVLGPPPVEELLAVLDKIVKLDARLIFAEPVPDDVPKYRDIIKDPMDLLTMRRKAKRGKYKTIDAFASDFNLMIRNCMTFNPDTTIFYKEGKRIGKRGNEIIERNATALRGEPQRIRSKKRRKMGAGPTSEALSMLTSTGVVTIKDFGDVDQSGMIPEGVCDEQLADVALVLSDPVVKQLICNALMKNLVMCWQMKELPTDNLTCRALVQLLQIGNPSSVRRMIRKQDYVLRAPQVVTMRVVLPLLLRTMVEFRVYYALPVSLERDVELAAKGDVLNAVLWNSLLRASSAIRAIAKSFAVQCLVDHQIDAGSRLLHYLLLAEEESLLRDRVLLHAVTEVVLEQVGVATASVGSNSSSEFASNSAENGEVTMTLSEQLQGLEVWKQIVDCFFVDVLAARILAAKKATGCIIRFAEGAIDQVEDAHSSTVASDTALSKKRKRQRVVRSFPSPVFHEKTVMMLSSLFATIGKGGSAAGVDLMITSYLTRTLSVLRNNCLCLEDFEALWNSSVFYGCRHYYELMLAKCPAVRKELFAVVPSDIKTGASDVHQATLGAAADSVMQGADTDAQRATTTAASDATVQGTDTDAQNATTTTAADAAIQGADSDVDCTTGASATITLDNAEAEIGGSTGPEKQVDVKSAVQADGANVTSEADATNVESKSEDASSGVVTEAVGAQGASTEINMTDTDATHLAPSCMTDIDDVENRKSDAGSIVEPKHNGNLTVEEVVEKSELRGGNKTSDIEVSASIAANAPGTAPALESGTESTASCRMQNYDVLDDHNKVDVIVDSNGAPKDVVVEPVVNFVEHDGDKQDG
uniref:Bromo domain-containing protein n=1 Tax=Peronospora matthiolae TaxID=2874970 RepID=A0AAV1URK1_9STRA